MSDMSLSRSRFIGASVLLAGLLLVGAGCGKKAAAPAVTGPNSAAAPAAAEVQKPAPAAPVAANDACNNPYYPLKNGYEIDYQVASQGSNIDLKIAVSDVATGRAKLTTTINYMGSHTISQNLTCGANGSIEGDTYMDMAGAFGSPLKITTKSASGDVLPKALKVGDKWTTRYDTETDMSSYKIPNVTKASGYVETVNEVVGEEKVSVPAGDFTAMKVRADSVSSFTVMAGSPPQETRSTSYQWYVSGVGLVKTEDVTNKSVMTAVKIVNP